MTISDKYARFVVPLTAPDKFGAPLPPEPEPDATLAPEPIWTQQVLFRTTPAAAKRYREQAKAAGMTVSAWIRSRLG